ncbi:MAG TPA: hypothetical protein VN827_05265 [Chthoniobacterales bacterium]|jgi:hypothetical protein|nr:hypothetical protein [Chthoniobacterales bacterium]
MTGSADELKRAGFKIIVFCLLAGLLVIALWPAFQSPGQPEDEGITLVYPELLLKGRLPYRDFESIYGPGNLLILSATYSIFGPNIFVERAVGLIYRLIILLAIFGTAQRWGTFVASACALVAVVILDHSEAWANTWFAGTAFALCGVWMMANVRSGWRCFAAGLFGGIALLCRCDLGPALAISALPLFLSMERAAKHKFLGGLVVALLPLLWFGIVVGPAQLVDDLFLLPVFRLGPGATLPISTATADVVWIFCFYLVASAVNVAAGFVALREPAPERGRLLLGAALLGLSLIHYSLSRFDSGHVTNGAVVSFAFLPVSISVLFSLVTKPLSRRVKIIVASIVALGAIALLKLGPHHKGVFIKQNGRLFPLAKTSLPQAADQALSELQRASFPGQSLFVGPADLRRTIYCDTWIYHLFPQLRPATYFLEMNPGSANAPGSRLTRDVASADWLVLNRAWDNIVEPNRSSEFGPDEPNNIVRAEFDLWRAYGPYLILRNKRLRNMIEQ